MCTKSCNKCQNRTLHCWILLHHSKCFTSFGSSAAGFLTRWSCSMQCLKVFLDSHKEMKHLFKISSKFQLWCLRIFKGFWGILFYPVKKSTCMKNNGVPRRCQDCVSWFCAQLWRSALTALQERNPIKCANLLKTSHFRLTPSYQLTCSHTCKATRSWDDATLKPHCSAERKTSILIPLAAVNKPPANCQRILNASWLESLVMILPRHQAEASTSDTVGKGFECSHTGLQVLLQLTLHSVSVFTLK